MSETQYGASAQNRSKYKTVTNVMFEAAFSNRARKHLRLNTQRNHHGPPIKKSTKNRATENKTDRHDLKAHPHLYARRNDSRSLPISGPQAPPTIRTLVRGEVPEDVGM